MTFVVARVAAWLVLVALGARDPVTPAPPDLVIVLLPSAAVAVVALLATVRSAWRGPALVPFAAEHGRVCDELESEPVRAYAQVRGAIGGAGHVAPRRLALPVVAWLGALVAGARILGWPLVERFGAFPALVATLAAIAAALFPSRPYWYLEAMGGRAVVSPPDAVDALIARERSEDPSRVAAIRASGQPDPVLRRSAALARARLAMLSSVEGRPGTIVPIARPPRYPVRRTMVVAQDGLEFEAATINVSEGGLALRWPWEIPVVAREVVVRVDGRGSDGALDAVVCWNRADLGAESGHARTVGLKVVGGGPAREGWRALVERAATVEDGRVEPSASRGTRSPPGA